MVSTTGLIVAAVALLIILALIIARFCGGPGCPGCGMTAGQCGEAKAHGYRACCPDCRH